MQNGRNPMKRQTLTGTKITSLGGSEGLRLPLLRERRDCRLRGKFLRVFAWPLLAASFLVLPLLPLLVLVS